MKPAPEPASVHPKSRVLSESARRILSVRRFRLALVGRSLNVVRNQISLQKITFRFSPSNLAHKSSALAWRVNGRATLRPRRTWCLLAQQHGPNTLARAAAPCQAFRDSIACLSRATRSRQRTPHWRSGEAHLAKLSGHNQAATACKTTGWVGWTGSWCHFSRVSPALHRPERPPPPTHTRKLLILIGFGGKWHESLS